MSSSKNPPSGKSESGGPSRYSKSCGVKEGARLFEAKRSNCVLCCLRLVMVSGDLRTSQYTVEDVLT
jgi:hypothetical protein